jgi:hypothetical protein
VLLNNVARLHLTDVPITEMRLQEFRDNLRNLQLLWAELLDTEDIEYMYVVLEAYMHRFGVFAARAHPAELLDDVENVDVICEATNLNPVTTHRLSVTYIRSVLAFFLVAYRSLALADVAVDLPPEPAKVEFHRHLLAAGMDTYYELSVVYDCPVGSILDYMHSFSGMFSNVNQVIFFAFPSYVRRPQNPFEEIIGGTDHIRILPLFNQIYPNARILREEACVPQDATPPQHNEECSLPPLGETKDPGDWVFWVVPSRIYAYHKPSGFVYRATENIHSLFNAVAGMV